MGCGPPRIQDLAEGAPCVKLALQALHVDEQADDDHVGVILLGRNGTCAQGMHQGESARNRHRAYR